MVSDEDSLGHITCHSGGLVFYSLWQVVRRTTLETRAKYRDTEKTCCARRQTDTGARVLHIPI